MDNCVTRDRFCHAGRTRHLLHSRTPWLFFTRDHPLGNDWRWYRRHRHNRDEDDYWDQEERFAWILALPDDDDEIDLGVADGCTCTIAM